MAKVLMLFYAMIVFHSIYLIASNLDSKPFFHPFKIFLIT